IRRRTPTGSAIRSHPATVAVPAVGSSRVVSMRSVVVLPAPFGPRKPTISPASTSRSTPTTARTSCFFLRKVRASPRAWITPDSIDHVTHRSRTHSPGAGGASAAAGLAGDVGDGDEGTEDVEQVLALDPDGALPDPLGAADPGGHLGHVTGLHVELEPRRAGDPGGPTPPAATRRTASAAPARMRRQD